MSGWWRSLCAAHGVRVAYGQAYHHQANGRAEAAGQQIQRKLAKLVLDIEEEKANWVELLPKALRLIHDVPGETGLSPYEVVFGRHRPLAGIPYQPLREAPDAANFLEERARIHAKMAKLWNYMHQKRAETTNARRREPPALKVGSNVW